MKQLIKIFKGLNTASDQSDIPLDYGIKFHNCKVNQGYIESIKYSIENITSQNYIITGKCYLADNYPSKYDEQLNRIVIENKEEYTLYNYAVYLTDDKITYVIEIKDENYNIIGIFNIGIIDELGSIKQVFNVDGELIIYFTNEVVLFNKLSRVKKNPAGIVNSTRFQVTRLNKTRDRIKDRIKINSELTNNNVISAGNACKLSYLYTHTPFENNFVHRVVLGVFTDNKRMYSKTVTKKFYVSEIGETGIFEMAFNTSESDYHLYTLRRLEVINGRQKLTNLLVHISDNNNENYFESVYYTGNPVNIVVNPVTVIHKDGLAKIVTVYGQFIEILLKSTAYTADIFKIHNIKDDDIIGNTDIDYRLIYRLFSTENAGIVKNSSRNAQLILTGLINNHTEIYLTKKDVVYKGTPNHLFVINNSIEIPNKLDELWNNFVLTKLRFYLKFDNEAEELIREIDFCDINAGIFYKLDFVVNKYHLTGISLLNNTGLTLIDIETPIIPDYVKKINNLILGYKDGEVYIPNYGSGRFQKYYVYNSRIIDKIPDYIVAYGRLSGNLQIYTKDYSQTYVIQSDNQGDIILLPSPRILSINLLNRFHLAEDSDKVFILTKKGLILYTGEESKLISIPINNIIEEYYNNLVIVYDNVNKYLLMLNRTEKLIYIYDETTDSWFTIDFPYEFASLIDIKSENGNTIIRSKTNNNYNTYLIRFNIGEIKLSEVIFPKAIFDDLLIKKYITNVIFDTDNNTEIKLILDNTEYNAGYKNKITIPYKNRKPFTKLNMGIKFKGIIKTIHYILEIAGESL